MLRIFDRLGNQVFEIQDYDNATKAFSGKNQSGEDLPGGTYYYTLDFGSGGKRTGFLSLKR